MKLLGLISLLCLLAFSQFLSAAEPPEHKYTPRQQIEIAATTRAAFDHSGAAVIHSTLPDGSLHADHNGTLGNVTVARLGADGRVETLCTSDEEAATAWMAGEDISKDNTLSIAEIIPE